MYTPLYHLGMAYLFPTQVHPWVHSGLQDTKDGAHRQLMVTYLRYVLQLSALEVCVQYSIV